MSTFPGAQTRYPTARGFCLTEALVGLALVGGVLLFGFALQAQHFREARETELEAGLLERGRAIAESLREGLHPLATGPVDLDLAWPGGATGQEAYSFQLAVAPTEVSGLCDVEIVGRAFGRRWHDLSLRTRVYLPTVPCQ